MTEVYRRKPAPPDWPRPAGIVTATVDLLTNTQWAAGCPGVEATEFFIAGTEPTVPCNLMPGLSIPDTTGFSTLPPATPQTGGITPVPNGQPAPRDTTMSSMPANPMGGRVVPGATPMPRLAQPRDTFGLTRPQPAPVRPAPPRDTGRVRIDSVKRGIPRRDTIRPRADSIQQQGRRPAPELIS